MTFGVLGENILNARINVVQRRNLAFITVERFLTPCNK